MIDIKDYLDKKSKGLVSVVKTDPAPSELEAVAYAVAYKRYNPDDGGRLPDEVKGVSARELDDARADLVKQLADLDAFIADCQTA